MSLFPPGTQLPFDTDGGVARAYQRFTIAVRQLRDEAHSSQAAFTALVLSMAQGPLQDPRGRGRTLPPRDEEQLEADLKHHAEQRREATVRMAREFYEKNPFQAPPGYFTIPVLWPPACWMYGSYPTGPRPVPAGWNPPKAKRRHK